MFLTSFRFIAVISLFTIFSTKLNSVRAVFNPDDNYSFVALIDIVLTDGAKRTCTGTIIHDSVVITAAHCFTQERHNYIVAELTACFVVIGTKKMFDTGYEQYFPIERIMTHPRYRGWTADLALVFTFASMVSDKPGRIVPLVSDNIKAAVDANVTVISWGRCKDEIEQIKLPEFEFGTSSEESSSYEELPTTKKRTKLRKRFKIKAKGKYKNKSGEHFKKAHTSIQYEQLRAAVKDPPYPQLRDNVMESASNRDRFETFKSVLRQRSTTVLDPDMTYGHIIRNYTDFNSQEKRKYWQKQKKSQSIQSKLDIRKHRNSYLQTTHNVMSYYENNWRRKMGTQQNKLTIEVFGFVNVASCKKIIEKAMPSLYRIHNGNEIICYSNEDRYVTIEDSGAPAMRHGHLVAVTVGGAEFDGDNVAVAMKISCFCSWIAENLPDGGPHMQCCTNCCGVQAPPSQEFSGEKIYRHMPKRHKKLLLK